MERRGTFRSVIAIICILAVVAAAVWFVKKRRPAQQNQYRTEKVGRGDVLMTVTATGTLSAVTTVQVGSQVSGMISRLYADFNSRVKKGQLLAELDPTPLQAQVEQRQADLTKAQVDLRNTEITLNRQQRLVASGLAAQADLDAANAARDSAKAQVEQSSAALRQSQTNLRYTTILSPIDGVVADRQYDVGQTVAASFQAPTLFTIAQDLTKMQVQADVDQSDIGRIEIGQTVRFTVDAYPEEEFRGKISQIRLNATVNQNVVSYPVIIEVPNPDEKLRPKMTANVTVEVAKVSDVLRVANAALRFRPESSKSDSTTTGDASSGSSTAGGSERRTADAAQPGGAMGGAAGVWNTTRGGRGHKKGEQTVYTLVAGKPQPVSIRTGMTDGRFTQVVSGELNAGDTVIVGPATSKVQGPAGPRGMGRF
jgi:RND family efflux transporter, MFP subunit